MITRSRGSPEPSPLTETAETGWAINVGKGTAPGVKMNAEHEIQFTFAQAGRGGSEAVEVSLHHEKNTNYNVGRFALERVRNTAPAPIEG